MNTSPSRSVPPSPSLATGPGPASSSPMAPSKPRAISSAPAASCSRLRNTVLASAGERGFPTGGPIITFLPLDAAGDGCFRDVVEAVAARLADVKYPCPPLYTPSDGERGKGETPGGVGRLHSVPLDCRLSVAVAVDPRLDDSLADSPADDAEVGRRYWPRYAPHTNARSVAKARSVFVISRSRCVRLDVTDEGVRGERTGAVGERVMAEGKSGAGMFDRLGLFAESIPSSLAALPEGWTISLPIALSIGTEGERTGRGGSWISSLMAPGEWPVMAWREMSDVVVAVLRADDSGESVCVCGRMVVRGAGNVGEKFCESALLCKVDETYEATRQTHVAGRARPIRLPPQIIHPALALDTPLPIPCTLRGHPKLAHIPHGPRRRRTRVLRVRAGVRQGREPFCAVLVAVCIRIRTGVEVTHLRGERDIGAGRHLHQTVPRIVLCPPDDRGGGIVSRGR